MTSAPQRKRRWIIAALIAGIVFLGGVAVEVLSDDLKRILEPYRNYVWSILGLAFLAAIIMAIKESRAKDDPPEEKPQSERDISAGEVKDSILNTGDKNLIANHTQGDVVGGDKITDIDADGDIVQVKHVHIHAPETRDPSPLHQLPAPPRDFTGRAEELEDLLANIQQGVAISGLRGQGGVGKTALALKLAEIIMDRYPDAQFYLDLRGVSANPLSSADAMAHVIRAYHSTAKLPESEAELSAIYHSLLHNKRALILMDNAKDRRQVEPLLPPAGCVLIVTSRVHFTLPGLYDKDLDALPLEDARKLLLTIAKRIGDAADEIAGLCGRLPLALRVAASAIAERRNLSPADYARRLRDARHRLSQLKEVDVVLNESCELLDEESRRRWRMLAVFAKTFDESAAAAVWEMEEDAANDALGDLLTYSLIEYDTASSRYSLHDLARIFADGRLSDIERDAAKQRHAQHYCQTLAQTTELYLQGGEAVKRGVALFDLERENIEAGWAWAESLMESDEEAAQMCIEYPTAGVYVLDLRQHPRERIRWLEFQLAAARRLKKRDYEGNATGNLGLAYADLGETRKAIEFYEQRLIIAREIGDRRGEGAATGNLGLAYAALGETRKAIEYHEKYLAIAREIGDRRGEGNALWNMSLSLDKLGECARAIECAEAALKIYAEIESPHAEMVRKKLAEWKEEAEE